MLFKNLSPGVNVSPLPSHLCNLLLVLHVYHLVLNTVLGSSAHPPEGATTAQHTVIHSVRH